MVRAFHISFLALALPLATPGFAQVCHPVHHHRVSHVHKAVHEASGLSVVIDQARLVSLPKGVKTVYVGNPVIADIQMVDPQHVFLLGKTFGLTNMIALDPDGKQISNQQVVVTNNFAAVTINRGPDQFDYMCTRGHCETAPRPGDPSPFVTTTEGAVGQHEGAASGAGTTAATAPTATAQNQ
ncbi:MAG TPA: pilus assembly protein N-terminal domain-containing protein [Rhizomicrobium sp.]|jgi:hypothetical protein|nr:pilus assembly protein N-terminal domain-containing protein [Rhizomicrobium sp.]